MALAPEDVNWVAHLARLELSPAELATLTSQLAAILDHINQLQQLATDGVEPLIHPFADTDVFRADEPAASLPTEAALANAPARKGDYYAVPAVLD